MIATVDSRTSLSSLGRGLPSPHLSACARPVYFFLDFSNIAVSAREVASSHGDGILESRDVRLNLPNIRALAQRDRRWGSGYAAAGFADEANGLQKHCEEAGISLQVSERGKLTNSEQNVDETIQLNMLLLTSKETQRGVVVLATGDGARRNDSGGFIAILDILSDHGFDVEVMAWRHSLNPALRRYVEARGKVIELDHFYHDVTFLQHARRPTSVSSIQRRIARSGLVKKI